jgi:hypothetical protein
LQPFGGALQYAYVNPALAIASMALAIEPSALMISGETADLITAFVAFAFVAFALIVIYLLSNCAEQELLDWTYCLIVLSIVNFGGIT